MTPVIQTCPHCGAPLAVTRFAAIVICSFCESTVRVDPASVSVSKYREALAEWNAPDDRERGQRFSIADTRWVAQRLVARGEISDVYLAKRARGPSELVLLKVVRDPEDAPLLEQEWAALRRLRDAALSQHVDLGSRVPSPVASGLLEDGRRACAYRWSGGFLHTFEAVREAYSEGVPPVASIWVWRRLLEILGVMRDARLVHGAILPNHLLIENGEHGVRLVGFSCADAPKAPLRALSTSFEDFYPARVLRSHELTAAMDMTMSARCVAYLLGGRGGALPAGVAAPLAELLRRAADDEAEADLDPWKLHKELGELGRSLFGPPAFHPIAMK